MRTTTARLLTAALLGALSLAAGPVQAALARPAHGASHGKGKSKRQVLVHCASVTVTCHPDSHHKGPAGPAGPAGAPGSPGAPGTAGQGIAYRIRSTAPVASSDGSLTSVGLSTPTFAQQANQDERLLGLVTVTNPSGNCESGKTNEGTLEGEVLLDGKLAGLIEAGGSTYSPGSNETIPILWASDPLQFELASEVGTLPVSSSAQTHILTVEVGDDCNASGAGHFTVDSIAIDVLTAS
jgi:hypothetical protein